MIRTTPPPLALLAELTTPFALAAALRPAAGA